MFYSISNDNQHVSFIALTERIQTICCNEGFKLYKNKASNGRNNISGLNIRRLRLAMPDRFVTDIELKVFAAFFGVSTDELLRTDSEVSPETTDIPIEQD